MRHLAHLGYLSAKGGASLASLGTKVPLPVPRRVITTTSNNILGIMALLLFRLEAWLGCWPDKACLSCKHPRLSAVQRRALRPSQA